MPLNMLTTIGQIYRQTADEYLAALQPGKPRPDPEEIELDIINMLALKVAALNDEITKGSKIRVHLSMPPYITARIIAALWPVYRIPCAGAEADPAHDLIGVYQEDGSDEGIYLTSDFALQRLFRQFNHAATTRDFSEFKAVLMETAERRMPCRDRDLIAVNNGIFDYGSKQLRSFSPDLVFLSKCRVNYVPSAVNPIIHNHDDGTDWDVEGWLSELSDDPEIVKLLWEILGAIIRPNVSWNKAAFLFSETGNNGKGTLCRLMQNLCGPGTYCSISLADFGKEFMLEPLMRASAVIVDENNVGEYVDRCANLKAVITGDVIYINRKYEKPLSFLFRGFMVQCLNELPRVKDKSESLYRRMLFVPFSKCFTGMERRYIKDDYLSRPAVLEYVLWKILNMDYYELSNPTACQSVMDTYRQYNDPLRQFADEIFPQLAWDMVPLAYLFDLYSAWFKRCYPGGRPLGKQKFNMSMFQLQPEIPGWMCPGLGAARRPGSDMSKPEPLSLEYNLTAWLNFACPDSKSSHYTVPVLKTNYKGYFIRVNSSPAATTAPAESKTM